MCHLHLFFLVGLVAIANGHMSIDRSKRYQRERVTASSKDNDLNHIRSLQLEKEFELQLAWWNWNFCTNAFFNKSFTPTNSLVPNGTVFLAGYPTFKKDNSSDTCRSETIVRKGTIGTGQQTVFFPIYNIPVYDFADDWETGTCGITFPNETDAIRLSVGESDNAKLSNTSFKEKIYSTVDGENINPVYLYDTAVYILDPCEDNRTQEEYFKLQVSPDYLGDTCDFEPFERIGGSDIGPMTGYYGIDTRTWADGESHTYEFGSISECITAKYVLTAKSPVPCTVSWDVYNSKSDKFVTTILGNGRTIKNPPPCGRINIEAVVPSCISKNITKVTIELYRNDMNNKLIRRKNETIGRYFLFGNKANLINDGKIKDGKYKIRAIVNGKIVTPFTTFTLATGRCN
jgi:hypothetical protein